MHSHTTLLAFGVLGSHSFWHDPKMFIFMRNTKNVGLYVVRISSMSEVIRIPKINGYTLTTKVKLEIAVISKDPLK